MRKDRRETAVLVPVKPLALAKSRLAPVTPSEDREKLVLSLARRVVAVASEAGTKVFVVTSDPFVAEALAAMAVSVVPDPPSAISLGLGSPEALNAALEAGASAAYDSGFKEVLVIPSDLPYLSVSDLLAAMRRPGDDGVVIAPSLDGGGTNALAARLPVPIPFSFGPGSFQMHLTLAIERGLPVRVLRLKGLCYDLDTPQQVKEYISSRSSASG